MIYALFLALIFHQLFFSKKRYFFHDVATIWALLYCCVASCSHKEEYCTAGPAKCTVIRLLLQRIARPRNARIYFSLFQLKLNACRIRTLVITPNNMVRRMRGLVCGLEIFQKGSVSQIQMRGLGKM